MSYAKAVLFWLSFLPIGLLMIVISFPAKIFEWLDDHLYKIALRFEWWALEYEKHGYGAAPYNFEE